MEITNASSLVVSTMPVWWPDNISDKITDIKEVDARKNMKT